MPLPSAHDVARSAGVSQSTVSRAFTSGASISPAIKATVLEAAERLGYRPNLIARSLIMGRSRIIGVVMGDPRNPFYVAAFSELSSRLAETGLHMLVFTSESNETSDAPVEDLLRYRVDALVLMSTQLSSDLAARCHREGITVVFFNRRARNSTGIASVTGTNPEGARDIAEHLIHQGYRRLAFMAGSADSSTSRERELAFMKLCAERGVRKPVRAVGDYERESAREAMRELLLLTPRPDAVFCANDVMAIASAEVARHEFGLSTGRDVGIVGYDDIEQVAWPSFEITTYSQPIRTMIDEVINMLAGRLKKHVRVQGSLVIRSSTVR